MTEKSNTSTGSATTKGKKIFATILILLGIAAGVKFIPGLVSPSPQTHSCSIKDTIKDTTCKKVSIPVLPSDSAHPILKNHNN